MTIPFIPLFPDGSSPVTEVLGYPTSILTASTGREQRIRLREYASREFTMRMVEMQAREVVRLLYALEQGWDFNAYVPFWPEAFQLTTDAIATDVTLNVDRTTERIIWANQYSQVLIWRGDGSFARYTITADAAGTIDIDPPLAEDWPTYSYVVPLWPCKITGVGQIDRANDNAVIVESLTARLDWGLPKRNANIIYEKWYLRSGPPLDPNGLGAQIVPDETDPLFQVLSDPPYNHVAPPPADPVTSFNLPDVSGLGRILRQKGSLGGDMGAGGSGTGYMADYVCSWVGPPLRGGQRIPPSRIRVVYKEASSLFFSWMVWRMGIWRPGTGVVASWSNINLDYLASRFFIPLNAYSYSDPLYGPGLALTQDGDRWVLGFSIIIQGNAGGSGFSTFVFNGNVEPVPWTNTAGAGGAAYVLIPKMNYLSEIA